jgi:hypothetical protein
MTFAKGSKSITTLNGVLISLGVVCVIRQSRWLFGEDVPYRRTPSGGCGLFYQLIRSLSIDLYDIFQKKFPGASLRCRRSQFVAESSEATPG